MKKDRIICRMAPTLGIGAVLCVLTFSAVADEASERSMGDDAFARRDYRNAVIYYRNALEQSDNDPDQWAIDALKLGEAGLYAGDTVGASRILEEFRRRNPARSAGLLPGKLLAAEGKLDEAIAFFEAMLKAPGDVALDEIDYQLAYLKMHAGNFTGAQRHFIILSKSNSAAWRKCGVNGKIYTDIRLGNFAAAEKELAHGDADDDWNRRLTMLALAGRGNLAEFGRKWKDFKSSVTPGPDEFFFRMLTSAADTAVKKSDYASAREYLTEAYLYAPTDGDRRDNLRRCINLLAPREPAATAAVIRQYLKLFPDADDRGLLLLQGGRLLAQNRKYSEAIDLFDRLLSDGGTPLAERLSAAKAAAAAAENAGDEHTVTRMFSFLIRNAANTRERISSECDQGEYYLRRRRWNDAERVFNSALSQSYGDQAERARYLLLQAQVGGNRGESALATAAAVARSKRSEYREYGEYQSAVATAALNKTAEARELYLKFAQSHPRSKFASDARFAAAQISRRSGKYAEAASEFSAFAVDYPRSVNAPAALFFAVQCGTLADNRSVAETAFNRLTANYAATPARTAAALELAEYLLNSGASEIALTVIAAVEPKNAVASDELSLLKAKALAANKQADKALSVLKKLMDDVPDSPIAADAALTVGRIAFDSGDYKTAVGGFQRAAQLRPTGIFGDIASGGVADCVVRADDAAPDPDGLRAAAAIYRKLTENSKFPAIRLRSGYHLGRCLEKTGDVDGAIAAWERTLYLAAELKRHGNVPTPIWCAKSAYAAARALGDARRPDGRQRALRVINQYEELNLPESGEDFRRLRQNIRSQYQYR